MTLSMRPLKMGHFQLGIGIHVNGVGIYFGFAVLSLEW